MPDVRLAKDEPGAECVRGGGGVGREAVVGIAGADVRPVRRRAGIVLGVKLEWRTRA